MADFQIVRRTQITQVSWAQWVMASDQLYLASCPMVRRGGSPSDHHVLSLLKDRPLQDV